MTRDFLHFSLWIVSLKALPADHRPQSSLYCKSYQFFPMGMRKSSETLLPIKSSNWYCNTCMLSWSRKSILLHKVSKLWVKTSLSFELKLNITWWKIIFDGCNVLINNHVMKWQQSMIFKAKLTKDTLLTCDNLLRVKLSSSSAEGGLKDEPWTFGTCDLTKNV